MFLLFLRATFCAASRGANRCVFVIGSVLSVRFCCWFGSAGSVRSVPFGSVGSLQFGRFSRFSRFGSVRSVRSARFGRFGRFGKFGSVRSVRFGRRCISIVGYMFCCVASAHLMFTSALTLVEIRQKSKDELTPV